MVITKDTELSEILDSNSVIEIMVEMDNGINRIVEERTGVIESEMSGGGLSEETVIEGVPVLFNSANRLVQKYDKVKEISSPYIKGICSSSVSKEIEELERLRIEVKKAIDECIKQIDDVDIKIAGLKVMDSHSYEMGYIGQDENAELQRLNTEKTKYEEKLIQIDTRLRNIEGVAAEYGLTVDITLKNEIPSFEVDENGRPTSTPYNFTVDSHHRLDVPGFGICYEASSGSSIEYHYNADNNLFYWDSAGTDWSNYDYSDNFYAITPTDMLDSEIKGGLVIG